MGKIVYFVLATAVMGANAALPPSGNLYVNGQVATLPVPPKRVASSLREREPLRAHEAFAEFSSKRPLSPPSPYVGGVRQSRYRDFARLIFK